MRLFETSNPSCVCVLPDGTKSMESTMQEIRRGRPAKLKTAKQVFHYHSNGEQSWHWSDQIVTRPDLAE